MEHGFKELDLDFKTWMDPEWMWMSRVGNNMQQLSVEFNFRCGFQDFGSGFRETSMHVKNGTWISRAQSDIQEQEMEF